MGGGNAPALDELSTPAGAHFAAHVALLSPHLLSRAVTPQAYDAPEARAVRDVALKPRARASCTGSSK